MFKRGRRQSFFSVVIASYNSAAWIKHTIRSVLEQTYRNFEVIVVGDGCTDGTEELLKTEFGKRVRWKNLPSNFGSQSAPNNEGIRVAHGSHIVYLGHAGRGQIRIRDTSSAFAPLGPFNFVFMSSPLPQKISPIRCGSTSTIAKRTSRANGVPTEHTFSPAGFPRP